MLDPGDESRRKPRVTHARRRLARAFERQPPSAAAQQDDVAASAVRHPRDPALEPYRELVREWATGRLPGWAREGVDTGDLVQVTLLRAWKHLDKFRDQPEQNFRRYLRRILENEIIDNVRRAQRRPPRLDVLDELPDPTPTPLESLIDAEAVADIRRLIDRLLPRRRDALLLRLEGQRPYEEIGRILGVRGSTARMRATRALADLAAMLDAGDVPATS